MQPGSNVATRGRTQRDSHKGARHDDYTTIRSDGRPTSGGEVRPTAESTDHSIVPAERRTTDRLPSLAAVAVVAGGLSLAGTTLGTYGLDRLVPSAMEAGPTLQTALVGDISGQLLAAAIALRVLRDLSVVLGGVAIVLGCWVAVAGTVRIVGRR